MPVWAGLNSAGVRALGLFCGMDCLLAVDLRLDVLVSRMHGRRIEILCLDTLVHGARARFVLVPDWHLLVLRADFAETTSRRIGTQVVDSVGLTILPRYFGNLATENHTSFTTYRAMLVNPVIPTHCVYVHGVSITVQN